MLKSLSCTALLGICLMTYADNPPAANPNTPTAPSNPAASAPTTPKNIQLSNNQQTVNVSLPANATTGYQWFIQSYDHNLLSLQTYRYDKSDSKAVGSSGTAVFSFTVDPRFYDGPQTTSVSFIYQQPWNAGQNTTQTTVTISSTATNNDTLEWQKYPDVEETGPSTPNMVPSEAENANPQTNWLSLPTAMSTSGNSNS